MLPYIFDLGRLTMQSLGYLNIDETTLLNARNANLIISIQIITYNEIQK